MGKAPGRGKQAYRDNTEAAASGERKSSSVFGRSVSAEAGQREDEAGISFPDVYPDVGRYRIWASFSTRETFNGAV